jgi:hypothetical protein
MKLDLPFGWLKSLYIIRRVAFQANYDMNLAWQMCNVAPGTLVHGALQGCKARPG